MSSSLQQMAAASLVRVSSDGASSSSTQQLQKNSNTNTINTFESCFSAGLDLSEFAQSNSDSNSNIPQHTIVAASAELAQQKLNNVARRNNEEREEVMLERRAVDIVSAAKLSSATSIDDTLGNVIPRAINPHNKTASSTISTAYDNIDTMEEQNIQQVDGRSRDDNFVQFQDSSHKNEFLSCLVSNHKIEDEEGRFISHKSRITKKKQQQQIQHKKKSLGISGSGSRSGGGMAHSRRHVSSHTKIKNTPGSSRKGVAKKSRKSKY